MFEITAAALGKYLLVAAWCGFKYIVGLGLAVALRFSFTEQFVATAVGGVVGSYVFCYFGAGLRRWWQRLRRQGEPKPAPEWLGRIWARFGLVGVAVLTPFLMPALAAAVATAMGTPPARAARAMAISMVAWSAVFAWVADMVWFRALLGRLL